MSGRKQDWKRSKDRTLTARPWESIGARYRRSGLIERELPPRSDARDSRGRPISLPEVSLLKQKKSGDRP